MEKTKRKRLQAAGWRTGSVAEFLGLNAAENAFIELKLALADELKRRREHEHLTQLQVAKRLGSSQSRVAKMEAADASVSLDLLVRSVLELGASRQELARLVGRPQREQPKAAQRAVGTGTRRSAA